MPQPVHCLWWATNLLILAGLCDGLDGRVARATNTTSEFGVQLDSLADVISFGIAPAVLAYQFCSQQSLGLEHWTRITIWITSFFFVGCSAMRLARFNIQESSADTRFFIGMPTPVGAACIASVILYHRSPLTKTGQIYPFAFALFLIGLFLVSNLRFPSLKKRLKSRPSTNWITALIVIILLILIFSFDPFLLILCITYVFSAIAINIAWKLGWRGIEPPN
jgi:CDP-diacylglycerol--serine O-phosphatidyltransferase